MGERLRSPGVSTGFKVLVFLHIICVIGGFGAVAYNALYMSLAQRRTGGGTGAVLEVNGLVSGLAELLIYAALLFGVGAVTASSSQIKFSDAWVSAAFAIYLVDLAILHGWIKRHQRSYAAIVRRLENPGEQPVDRETELGRLLGLEKRVGFGWGAFNLLIVAAVYLMVFKPGG
jgi:uncharacterized membrane protein